MVRLAVLLLDAGAAQLVLQGVATAFPAGQAGGENHAVVSQGRGRDSVRGAGGAEGAQHVSAGHPGVGGERQGIAGVIVEPGQDLGVPAADERAAGEVGLPALAGHLGGEPDVRRLRPL
jgi:hypothetical protein